MHAKYTHATFALRQRWPASHLQAIVETVNFTLIALSFGILGMPLSLVCVCACVCVCVCLYVCMCVRVCVHGYV